MLEGDKESFANTEKELMRGVLALADRPIQEIMTPRTEVIWIDAADSKQATLQIIRGSAHRQFLVSRGAVDEVIGIARKDDILELCLDDEPFDVMQIIQQPIAAPEGASILKVLELFKRSPVELAIVVNEFGGLEGIVTQTDLLEAIAGDLPHAGDGEPEAMQADDGSLLLDGAMSIHDAQQHLALGELPDGEFHSVAGLVVSLFGRLPHRGEHVQWDGWNFEVQDVQHRRVVRVRARRVAEVKNPSIR